LKFVPGIVVPGNYPRHSQEGSSLARRYEWYLSHVDNPFKEKDLVLLEPEQMALQMILSLKEANPAVDPTEQAKWYVPRDIWEGVQPSLTARPNAQVSSDPRLENGLTTLESSERILEKDSFKTYRTFESHAVADPATKGAESKILVTPIPPPPRKRTKGRRR